MLEKYTRFKRLEDLVRAKSTKVFKHDCTSTDEKVLDKLIETKSCLATGFSISSAVSRGIISK
jgi:hypothetical protein